MLAFIHAERRQNRQTHDIHSIIQLTGLRCACLNIIILLSTILPWEDVDRHPSRGMRFLPPPRDRPVPTTRQLPQREIIPAPRAPGRPIIIINEILVVATRRMGPNLAVETMAVPVLPQRSPSRHVPALIHGQSQVRPRHPSKINKLRGSQVVVLLRIVVDTMEN